MFVMLSVRTSTVRERRAETGKKVTTTISNYINNNIDKVLSYKKTTKKLSATSSTLSSSPVNKTTQTTTTTTTTTTTSSININNFNNNNINNYNNNNNNSSKLHIQHSSLLSIDKITSAATILTTEDIDTFDTLSIAEATAQVAAATTNIAIQGKIRSAIARKTLKAQKNHTTIQPIIIGSPSTPVKPEQQDQPSATSKKKNFLLAELNNFKQPPAVQVPVATILNDLSPVPAPAKVKNKKVFNPISPMTPKGLQNNTPDVKAMRYYRLWIYTCNAVLLMAVIVFCGVAGKVLLADYKRLLINGLNLGQPSFIYAYLALLVQSGFLQLIGCLGALRLSEKLLNAYWLLLLVLLIGDAILGIFWMFKFDRVMNDLQPMLRNRLATEYSNSLEFTELWDRLQTEGKCCGIIGAQDFITTTSTSTSTSGSTGVATNRSYPSSCCSSDMSEQITISRRPLASAVVFRTDDNNLVNNNNSNQKNNLTDMVDLSWTHVVTAARGETKVVTTCRTVYPQGCLDKVVSWLKNTADILFVIGYCVIAFLKLCFLGILRYEIKEMIQKIKLLQTEMACAILGQDNEQQTQPLQQIPNVINGGIHTEPKVGNRDRERTRIGSGESERESLLAHELNTPKYLKHKQLYTCAEQTAAGDSDTNSSCALIVDESNPQQTKTINGNNNYELSEFDTKAPTYRLLNAPTVTKI